jgi:hypothetical protein
MQQANPCAAVYPLIVFNPDKHMMTPFWSLKEWLEFRR